ncbi:hypothetical protein ETU09_06295 [Apibacter muscae]|uniref:Uncharacterized protein n=1 Tax=Apibacter muscae TaxID=2509004 RepID=A0A563DCP3_9FLAO|nr:hypothetical protein [Apibacter muscae]TWP27701.1 hypothetical protein ETU09_06295 [Apibacter muscae]
MLKKILILFFILSSLKGISQTTTAEKQINQIFQLEEKEKIHQFFQAIEEYKQDHDYSDAMIMDSIFAEITPPVLVNFIKSINKEIFIQEKEFTKDYEFNIFPQEYAANMPCADVVSLRFLEEKNQFLLMVGNSFYVEDFGCTESGTSYLFKIEKGKIKIINIMEVG